MVGHNNTGANVPLVKRTFVLGVINGTGFIFSFSLLHPSTVLPVLVKELMGDSMIYLGIMAWVFTGGWFWLQVLLQNKLETSPRKLVFYRISAGIRIVTWSLLTALLWWGQNLPRELIYLGLVMLMFAYTSAGGLGMIPFWDIVAKSIPAKRRASFFGMRRFLGGLLAVFVGGALIHAALDPDSRWAFPRNYGVLALVSLIVVCISFLAFCWVREPIHRVHSHRLSLNRQLRRGPRIFRRDPDVRSLVYVRVLAALAMHMTFPFLFRFMTDELKTPIAMAGYFTSVHLLSATVSNVLWSYVGDSRGTRLLLKSATILVLAVPVAALITPLLSTTPLFRLYELTFSAQLLGMTTAFLLLGGAMAGQMLGETNYLMEIAPERKRPTYLGLNALVTMLLSTGPIVGALLIGDARRFQLGFCLSIALAAGAFIAARRLREPRDAGDDRPSPAAPITEDIRTEPADNEEPVAQSK